MNDEHECVLWVLNPDYVKGICKTFTIYVSVFGRKQSPTIRSLFSCDTAFSATVQEYVI